jgi:hypothetical protein
MQRTCRFDSLSEPPRYGDNMVNSTRFKLIEGAKRISKQLSFAPTFLADSIELSPDLPAKFSREIFPFPYYTHKFPCARLGESRPVRPFRREQNEQTELPPS